VVLAHLCTFVEVKRLFSTVPDAKKRRQKEVTGVTGRWIRRGWRVRSVQPAGARGEVLGFVIGVSVAPWDRRVRSCTQESNLRGRIDRTRSVDEIALWTLSVL
jgi:SMC interacting uncharacterized protein involved in chromosome segregation